MSAVVILFIQKIKTNHKSDWFLFGGRGWILSQALRTFGLMSKQSTGLFLCRSLPRRLRRSLPLVVRIHFVYTKIKINIGVPKKRELFGEKEEQRYECRGDF